MDREKLETMFAQANEAVDVIDILVNQNKACINMERFLNDKGLIEEYKEWLLKQEEGAGETAFNGRKSITTYGNEVDVPMTEIDNEMYKIIGGRKCERYPGYFWDSFADLVSSSDIIPFMILIEQNYETPIHEFDDYGTLINALYVAGASTNEIIFAIVRPSSISDGYLNTKLSDVPEMLDRRMIHLNRVANSDTARLYIKRRSEYSPLYEEIEQKLCAFEYAEPYMTIRDLIR